MNELDLFAPVPEIDLWTILPETENVPTNPKGVTCLYAHQLKNHLMAYADTQEGAHEGISSLRDATKIHKMLENLTTHDT
jgi:hypothetical protein